MMTKKDYIRAAALVQERALDYPEGHCVPKELETAFVVFFSGDNPRFDAFRFREACAVPHRGLP